MSRWKCSVARRLALGAALAACGACHEAGPSLTLYSGARLPLSPRPLSGLRARVAIPEAEVDRTFAIGPGRFDLEVEVSQTGGMDLRLDISGDPPGAEGERLLLTYESFIQVEEGEVTNVEIGEGDLTPVDSNSDGISDWTEFYYGCESGQCEWLQVSAGGQHTCAISWTRHIYCWGSNLHGQLGIDATVYNDLEYGSPIPITVDTAWMQVSAGRSHTCAITRDGGELWCWGDNSSGQCGQDVVGPRSGALRVNTGATSDPWALVSAGAAHTCAITRMGELFCWGAAAEGQIGRLGAGPYDAAPNHVANPAGREWEMVTAGGEHTCALDAEGIAYCWGSNAFLQSNPQAGVDPIDGPMELSGYPILSAVTAGDRHTCAATAADVACWGAGDRGQTGIGRSGPATTGVLINNVPYRSLSAGAAHTCVVDSQGQPWCWGDTGDGRLGVQPAAEPAGQTGVPLGGVWQELVAGGAHTCGRTGDLMQCFGANNDGQLGGGVVGLVRAPLTGTALQGVSVVAAGADNTCAIAGSEVRCWGANDTGVVDALPGVDDAGTTVVAFTGTPVGVAVGADHVCVRDGSAQLSCWGDNSRGQMGQGDVAQRTGIVPITSPTGQPWLGVVAGDFHTCGYVQTGAATGLYNVYCWGDSGACQSGTCGGQRLNPSAALSDLPHEPILAAGSAHSCAIQVQDDAAREGSLWCWGDSSANTGPQPVVQMGADIDWTAVVAGSQLTCGIRANGTPPSLWCRGRNDLGQLATDPAATPWADSFVEVTTPFAVSRVVSGRQHVCASPITGSPACWGDNAQGQLGIGSATAFRPIPVTLSDPWGMLAAGGAHTCGIETSSNRVVCWGSNVRGQLGIGPSWADVPVTIP